MNRFSFLLLFLLNLSSPISAQWTLNGSVTDKKTKEPIPYVQIKVEGKDKGTLTNMEGEFSLEVMDSDTLMFAFVGYTDIRMIAGKIKDKDALNVKMSAKAFQLDEVLVTPKPPEWYVKESIRRLPNYYANQAYNSTIFSRELVRINGEFYTLSESILKGRFVSPFDEASSGDTTRVGILAYRYFENQGAGEELIDEKKSAKRVKKQEKENRKKEKKGEEIEEVKTDAEEMYETFKSFFASISVYQLWDSTAVIASYRDTAKNESEIRYTQGRFFNEPDQRRMEIRMHNKKNEEKSQMTGALILDYDSLEFVSADVDFTPRGVAWGAVKTAIRLFGYKILSFSFKIAYQYKEVDGKFLPHNTVISFHSDFEKIHWFSPNDPFSIDVKTYNLVVDSDFPASDHCTQYKALHKKKHISDQVKSGFGQEVWNDYKGMIKTEKVFSDQAN